MPSRRLRSLKVVRSDYKPLHRIRADMISRRAAGCFLFIIKSCLESLKNLAYAEIYLFKFDF